ncbi:biotin--[acetyl-CoA-carboxylase] ligase [Paenibacillus sp. LHD-117]|uniref:biotin--[acetyl-CoA-carboxylase] ligase n=1 Tax=Paenibacillus sp. LHD-117 TaxID=3071412 RepID=UPI0027DFB980|nr:biotin--[acetyl-CoA-carboxylase] ligase [Paenibacillus sp. LHD-117]MDQ6418197.1 biotin--[acetyl-CoA-carboxylase] ligase [Paenibacillus sp. LHD-117]
MSNETLVQLFRDHPGQFVSGAKMSEALNVSRTAIWKSIKKLEAAGYEFEASTKLGYKLLFEPDKLDSNVLDSALKTSRFGRLVTIAGEVPSTQDLARKAAEDGVSEGMLVIAEQQVSGRGRMGRSWVSPYGKGIWMSMVLRPSVPIHCAPQLTLLAAVALCRSLRRVTRLPIGIKWPNDLLVDGRKISGILLESAAEDERLKYIVAGIGISVNLAEGDYPEEVLGKATSLRVASGRTYDRTELIADFLAEWEQLYDLFLQEGFRSIASLWESLAVSLGKQVKLVTPQGEITGIPESLDESGAIRVRREDGTLVTIFSAEMGEPLDSPVNRA